MVVEILQLREALLAGELLGIGAFGERIDADVDLGELAAAARLLLVAVAAVGVDLHRFAVRNFRLVRFDLDVVAALELLLREHAGAARSCR